METKYKLIDTDISKDIAKKIVGKQVTVERVKSKGGPTTKQRAKAPAWFAEFRDEVMERFENLENDISSLKKTQDQQNKRLGNIENRLDRQGKRIENIENRMDKQDNRLENIENRLDRQDERFENIEHELSI